MGGGRPVPDRGQGREDVGARQDDDPRGGRGRGGRAGDPAAQRQVARAREGDRVLPAVGDDRDSFFLLQVIQLNSFLSPSLRFLHRLTTKPWRRELLGMYSSSDEQHELESSL